MSGSDLITVGSKTPDFKLQASDGATYRMSDILLDRHAVLIFYPGNNTPG